MVTGLAAGSVVAGYRVESRVGVGGMAMVFRARDESLGRIAALKVLAPGVADDTAFRERFIRESRAAAVVDHPHIIPVYGAGEFEGVLYLAMRFVAGGDLRALLQREGPLTSSRAAFLLSPLASALDAGHAAGLVHRDVKPANILIDTSPGRPDHLYLSDFGLAKGNATTGLTGTGQFLGTLDYCAPEQIGGKPTRPQTDQYALGCDSAAPETSLPPVVNQARRRRPRRGMLAAGAVVVAAGGVAAALALSSPADSPASQPGNYPASTTASSSPPPFATLTEPGGAAPTNVAFKSDGTLVTVDAADAYSWNIATGTPTQTNFSNAVIFADGAVPFAGGKSMTGGTDDNVAYVWATAGGNLIATLAAPRGTTVNAYAISPDGTEAATADSDGRTYVWKISG